jgi:hypothetical protein
MLVLFLAFLLEATSSGTFNGMFLQGPIKIRVSAQELWFLIPWFLISGTLQD